MRMPFETIAMIGAVAKILGVAFPFFGVANFKSSSIGSGRCFGVANKRRQSLSRFRVRFIFTELCGNLLLISRRRPPQSVAKMKGHDK